MKIFPPSAPRREFIRDSMRYAALAGIGALTALVVARGGPLVGRVCPGAGCCGGCPFQPRCDLPSAAELKRRLSAAQDRHEEPS